MLPIVGIRPMSGRTGTTLLMNLLGTSPAIAFDRRHPAEYRIASYLVEMSRRMTEPYQEGQHVGVTDFFFGTHGTWGPLPFRSEAVDVESWCPGLLRSMWASASNALREVRPGARWYAEKLAVDVAPFAEAGIDVLTIDLIRDPRDILASRRSFQSGGTEHWARGADTFAAELASRLDELDTDPPDLRLRYEDLACDLDRTAQVLADRLGVELDPSNVDRPAKHVTTPSAAASVGRWQEELPAGDAASLAPIAAHLDY